MSSHLLVHASDSPMLCFLYSLPGAPPSTSPVPSFTSASQGTPRLPPAPTLPPVPLPSIGDVAFSHNDRHMHAPQMAAKFVPRAPAALHFHPHVDPLIAYTPRAADAHSYGAWDMLYDPRTVQITDSGLAALSWVHLIARCAIWAAPQHGGRALRSLTLVFRFLPLEIKITPAHSSPHDTRRGRAAFVSIWDVLVGLHSGLQAQVDSAVLAGLAGPEREGVCRSADRRMLLLDGDRQPARRPVLRNIDLLAGRRFLGIRVATHSEVPRGTRRRFGEVFVVEVGSG